MIHYLVADDVPATRATIDDFLRDTIEEEFNVPAQGTTCGRVSEVLEEIKKPGFDVDLIVLDMEFHGDILGGGLAVLQALNSQQCQTVVVYSGRLDYKMPDTGHSLSEELQVAFRIPAERIVDINRGGEAPLWRACVSVLKHKIG